MEIGDGVRSRWSLGGFIALGVIIVALVLALIGKMTWQSAGLLIALGVARLT